MTHLDPWSDNTRIFTVHSIHLIILTVKFAFIVFSIFSLARNFCTVLFCLHRFSFPGERKGVQALGHISTISMSESEFLENQSQPFHLLFYFRLLEK